MSVWIEYPGAVYHLMERGCCHGSAAFREMLVERIVERGCPSLSS